VNELSYLLEKNVEQKQPEAVIECFKSLDILRLLQNRPESYVDEAICDMLKNLLCQGEDSAVILEMCIKLLDSKLQNNMNEGSIIQFWLFTMRATSENNPALESLKQLFMKFSSVLTSNPS
jgi:hypothetical protein